MKSFFRTSLAVFAALAVGLSVAAAPASAATFNDYYVADNGKMFQVNDVLSVEKVAGFVNVKQISGTVHPFADATGAVWNKVVANPLFVSRFQQVGATQRYMRVAATSEISCISNQTVFAYPFQVQAEWFPDACALHAAVRAKAN